MYDPGTYWGKVTNQQLGTTSNGNPQFVLSFSVRGIVDPADPEGELSGDNFILLRNGEPLFPPHWSDTWKNGPRQFAIQPDTYAPILPEDTWSLQQITVDGEIISLDTGLTGTTWGPLIWP